MRNVLDQNVTSSLLSSCTMAACIVTKPFVCSHRKLAPAAAAQVPAPFPCSERGTTHKVYKLSPGGKGGLSLLYSFVTIASVDYVYISKEFDISSCLSLICKTRVGLGWPIDLQTTWTGFVWGRGMVVGVVLFFLLLPVLLVVLLFKCSTQSFANNVIQGCRDAVIIKVEDEIGQESNAW